KLISFKLCPFVQRSIITLIEKNVDFEIVYIDLKNKPDWFLNISPLGKVPLLQLDEQILFESSAINEYLEDAYPPALHPANLSLRAQNRAWIEIANQLSAAQFKLAMAQQATSAETAITQLTSLLQQLENKFGTGPFFNGPAFALVDACFAPFFTRQLLINRHLAPALTDNFPKTATYGEKLLARKSVVNSVVADYQQIYQQRLIDQQSWILNQAH
ncbi:MAG: glutathione S-transferase family protein, partial [Immundisolibacteraceae bacterium]|nr:glutathione S-transferase family protein [Immundisolibacteraceae bacterium]